jgi:hypothetical protein
MKKNGSNSVIGLFFLNNGMSEIRDDVFFAY